MNTIECDCEVCRNACEVRPGWFLPEQIPAVIEFFGKPLAELIGRELAYDWWNDSPDVIVIAPNVVRNNDEMYPSNPKRQCSLYVDGKCSIHVVKPHECAAYIHDRGDDVKPRHHAVKDAWRDVQDTFEFDRPVDDIRILIPSLSGFGGWWWSSNGDLEKP